jgi:hypothetical protein
MNKNIVYVVLGVIVLALLAWFYMQPSATEPVGGVAPVSTTTAAVSAAAGTSDTVKASVPGAIGKTNPFVQSSVNPVSGYQNPFGQ